MSFDSCQNKRCPREERYLNTDQIEGKQEREVSYRVLHIPFSQPYKKHAKMTEN